MDPILQQIYSTVLDAAPYVLAAYVLLWVGFFGYVSFILRRIGRLEKEIGVLEDSVARRTGSNPAS
jgi:CcmD family protein